MAQGPTESRLDSSEDRFRAAFDIRNEMFALLTSVGNRIGVESESMQKEGIEESDRQGKT